MTHLTIFCAALVRRAVSGQDGRTWTDLDKPHLTGLDRLTHAKYPVRMDIDVDRIADLRLDMASNIRAERARRRMSQDGVARGMNQFGYKWYPQTAGLVERCERPVLADELVSLAEVFGVPADRLWRTA